MLDWGANRVTFMIILHKKDLISHLKDSEYKIVTKQYLKISTTFLQYLTI
jgi:hypothetical protein